MARTRLNFQQNDIDDTPGKWMECWKKAESRQVKILYPARRGQLRRVAKVGRKSGVSDGLQKNAKELRRI